MDRSRSSRLAGGVGVACLLATSVGWADVRLPRVFASHMVMQRDVALPVWGWADGGEAVSVQFGDQAPVSTQANAAGQWRVALPAVKAGGPFVVKVTGKNSIVLEDVLVGEVWVCSGQSNMQWTVRSSLNPDKEIAEAQYPQIREFAVVRKPSGLPIPDVEGKWTVCGPDTVAEYTACGYFFGRELHQKLQAAVGLINTSWGGTRIEPWVPPAGFAGVPELKSIHDQVELTDPHSEPYKRTLTAYLDQTSAWLEKARAALAAETVLEPLSVYPRGLQPLTSHQEPATLYHGMVEPLVPFAIRGAIWYQGESNHNEGGLYTHKMRALIEGWRRVWDQGEFPFFYVQIAPYNYGNENPYILPEFWMAQAAALAVPNTGMVVTNDIADLKDIHPKNKQEVGRRLALLALSQTYGQVVAAVTGPTCKSMAVEGKTVRLSFDNVGSGLVSRDERPLTWFEIIGEDTDFVKAEAVIDGNTVVVSAAEVEKPLAVRFAWHRDAEPNLANREGLPARIFVAGTIPDRDPLKLKIAEAKDYQLVYTCDLGKAAREIKYDEDLRSRVAGAFERIAYFLELQKPGEPVKYLYVSMNAFTDDLAKTGVPWIGTKARFQQRVTGMNVISNVEGIVSGTDLKGGTIEFWPNNYGPANAGGVPNASSELWDFGDQIVDPEDGYGSMQVGNFEAKQTVFAFNNWKAGPNADLGIGDSEGKTRDWTFCANANSYSFKRLRVLVRPKK